MSKRRRNRVDLTEHQAEVLRLSHDGRGIASIDGKTTFLFNALPDEMVKFKYTKVRSQFAEGATTEVIKPSPKRQQPGCEHFGLCGGCSLQHISSDEQIELKTVMVLELLTQQGISPKTLVKPLRSEAWGYRRKARIGAKYVIKKEKMMIGFRERGRSLIADIDNCQVMDKRVGLQLESIKKILATMEARDQIPQLELAATDSTVALIVRHLEPLSDNDLDKLKALADQNNYHIYLQPKGIDSIALFYPEKATELLSYHLNEFNLEYFFHPSQFTQINEAINQQMIVQALDWLDIQTNDTTLDLFCGIGNFSLPLAQRAKKVVGIEGDSSSVNQATKNAEHNNITNCQFEVANLFENCSGSQWSKDTYSKVLLDPPRSGAQEIIELIPRWQPQVIVYVSCNPATFARDAAILHKQGYTLQKFGVMDMFPHTKHVEVMGQFKLLPLKEQ